MTRRSSALALAFALALPLSGSSLVARSAWAQDAAPAVSPAQQAQQLLKDANDYYHFHRSDPGAIGKIRGMLEQASRLQGGEKYDYLWQMARLQWWQADGEADTAKAAVLAEQGWKYGEKAVALNPNGVEGQFWLATNIGQYSLAKGVLWAIAQGLEGKFLTPLDKSIKMDAKFECAGPLRAKGNYYVNLPWPKRDLQKGIQMLNQSLQAAPCGVRSRYYLAQAYEKDGNIDAARAELEKILVAKTNDIDPGDLPRLQAWAKQMKARLR